MIKLTFSLDDREVYLNPNHIVQVNKSHVSDSSIITHVAHVDESYIEVKESPEKVVSLINSKGLNQQDIEIIQVMKSIYAPGSTHDVSSNELNKAIMNIRFLLTLLGE